MLALVPGARWQAPTRGAITQARQRLGTEPVKEVFQQVARPAATESTPGAWLHGQRVMAIDGFVPNSWTERVTVMVVIRWWWCGGVPADEALLIPGSRKVM
ncbi:transposase domain-containing protein [Actinomadura sp. ATCC 31491]|uniref:Transposase domain-containing protein n=2 Tax=Actinomadura luzonensis TaxID=2805427 RepID=A0ABT0FVK7_9ACTN|nr:transposase domain-containing protein [Actinomadura luzonensis]